MSALVYTFIVPAFLMGLMGGAHCIGMCGGIVCALTHSCQSKKNRNFSAFGYQLAYSVGRITTYSLLGGLTGFAGVVMAERAGSSGATILRYTSAMLIILSGFYIAGWWRYTDILERAGKFFWQPLSRLTRYFVPVTSLSQAYFLGGLWGLLPCGVVYSALLFSLSAHQVAGGALVMLAFGLGTLPALLLVGSVMQSYQHLLARKWVRTLSGLTLMVFGLLAFWLVIPTHGCTHCAH